MCPRRGNDPASGHPRAHQPPLGRGTSPPAWDGRLDAPGQRRRHLPSSAWTRRREVKQGKSGGSVGTTDQGKGKGRSVVRPMGTAAYGGKGQGKGKGRGEGRLGQGGRGSSKGGEKPMGTTAYGGKGSVGRAANGDRPVGAASCRRDHHTMASCQNPPPSPTHRRPGYQELGSGMSSGKLPSLTTHKADQRRVALWSGGSALTSCITSRMLYHCPCVPRRTVGPNGRVSRWHVIDCCVGERRYSTHCVLRPPTPQ